MNPYKKIGKIGVGGYHCSCCGPQPGVDRDRFRRKVRQALKRQLRKELEDM